MTTLFAVCAVLGGTVLVCQFVLTVFGMGHDIGGDAGHHFGFDHVAHDIGATHDASLDHTHDGTHHDSSWFFKVVTFRTVVAALTFFGLAGLAGDAGQWPRGQTLVVAVIAGGAAMYGVHWMMQGLHALKADGTVRTSWAIGQSGTVYLRIPARRSGLGKVQVNLRNRTMEYEAMTSQDELPIGTPVVVVKVIGPDTVEVEQSPNSGDTP